MKNFYFCYLLVVFIISSLSLNAQYIIAGQFDSTIFHYDINPDTTLYGIQYTPPGNLDIDINNDNVIDFKIQACNCSGLGGGFPNVQIIPLNQNEISISHIDSCFVGPNNLLVNAQSLAYSYNQNDTINNVGNWDTIPVMLNYSSWGVKGTWYFCQFSTFDSLPKYIGVRTITSMDTIYGWIKVRDVNNNNITIEEFAWSKFLPIGINKINKKPLFRFFPNPILNTINISLINSNYKSNTIKIYNMLGILLFEKTLNESDINIDISTYKKGVYILRVESDTFHNSEIFIKE